MLSSPTIKINLDGKYFSLSKQNFISELTIKNEIGFLGPGRIILGFVLAACLFIFVAESFHWPWMNDSAVMHYVTFLIDKGWAPYREIPDINMPGAYFSELFGIGLFGPSDLGWRLYDYSLVVVFIGATVTIASAYDWFAGLYAGILFTLIHGSEGPWQTAQRDEVMAILVVVGYAFMFHGTRKHRPHFFLLSGIFFGLAGTIKPTTFAVELLVVALALRNYKRQSIRIWTYLREAITGTSIILVGTLAFLMWRRSLLAFLHGIFRYTSYYISLNRPSFAYMLHHSTPRGLIVLLPVAVVLFFFNRSWKNWEFQAVVVGVIWGLGSYFIQYKGYTYHRYPFVAFALIWIGLECAVALRRKGPGSWVGAAGLLIGSLVVGPFYLSRIGHAEQSNALTMALVSDLSRFPESQLQNNVQCLDGVAGCYGALYRLRLQQSTGVMGDQLLFPSKATAVATNLQKEFWPEITSAHPAVFILTNYWYGGPQTFNKLNAWPEFADYLRSNYVIVVERTFSCSLQDAYPLGYRIYQRNSPIQSKITIPLSPGGETQNIASIMRSCEDR